MPQITGMQLSEKISKVRGDIPIILCTGFNAMVTPDSAEAAGIQQVMMKPVESDRLASMVRRLLERNSGKFRVERTGRTA
jgi:DNA-binding NtrC family response regulator